MSSDLGAWDPLSPESVTGLFGRLTTPWWIAGGYAIELLAGRPLRPHGDIDVLLLRRDQQIVHEVLDGWDIQAADPPGTLRPWPAGEWLPFGIQDIWCREHPDGPWRIQVMLDEADGGEWTSRRDARIHRPVASLGIRTDRGIPVLAPEVQLFYKSKRKLPKDEIDFAAVLPLLDSEARRWLDESLALTAPSHPWRAALSKNGGRREA
ncbi:nucleotidyltransferase domain-containing protein [Kribbella sp. NPDC054772]